MQQFNHLNECKELSHGITTRLGGHSKPPYDSLNLSYEVEDAPEDVEMNRSVVMEKLGIDHLNELRQTHGVDSHIIEQPLEIPLDGDALITDKKGLPLMVKHADCQPAIVYDPVKRALAVVHCGWRGNVQNIYGVIVKRLKDIYGCKPENLLVGIGPSLGPGAAEFVNYKEDFPEPFWGYMSKPNHFDLWEIGKQQFLEAGVLENHIELSKICTYTDQKHFFSFRRSKITGRMGTIAFLN